MGRSLVYAEFSGEEELERAVAGLLAAGDVTAAAEALVSLHEVRWVRGSTGMELLERALELVGGEPDTPAAAFVIGSLGRYYGLAGRGTEAVELDERTMACAQRLGDRRLYAWALNNRGIARFNGGDERGVRDIEQALEMSEEIGSFDAGRCRINLGSILDDFGDIESAHRHLVAGLAFARDQGIARFERLITTELAKNRMLAGRWDEALDLVAVFVDELRDAYHESELKGVLIVVAAERGEPLDDADIDRVTGRAREIGDTQVLLPWLANAARALATAGEITGARAYLDELTAFCRGPGAAYVQGLWLYDAAVAALLAGRSATLLEIVHADVRTRWHEAAVALLSGEPLQAAEVLRGMGAFDEAGARVAAAEALTAAGRHAEAVTQAARALAIYRPLRAAPGIARAQLLAGVAA
jgi:tetratricopeptide (TPR) repeat protein